MLGVLLLVGCAEEPEDDTGSPEDGPGPNIEEALPDGIWAGTVTETCDDDERALTYTVEIVDDVLVREFDDGEFNGVSEDTLVYEGVGLVQWMGLDGEPIGACTATHSVLDCATLEGEYVQEERTVTFSTSSLDWDATVSADGSSCTTTGHLAQVE